jgi:hypothetical protein
VSVGEQTGRAIASARLEGKGGTLLVEGTTAEGTPITLELRCSAFSEIVDSNG